MQAGALLRTLPRHLDRLSWLSAVISEFKCVALPVHRAVSVAACFMNAPTPSYLSIFCLYFLSFLALPHHSFGAIAWAWIYPNSMLLMLGCFLTKLGHWWM